MWRALLGFLLALVLLLRLSTPVGADTSVEVTVTAVGYICEAPGGFTVTYISDYEVGLSWSLGNNTANIMVRGATGRYPEDRDDGYLVYYGNDTSATDWVNMETLSVPIYYKAWSQAASGVWNEDPSSGEVEGISMILWALIFLCVSLFGLSFWQRKYWLFLACGITWFGLGMYGLVIRDTSTGDILWIIGWVGVALSIVCFLSWIWLRERIEPPSVLTEEESYDKELEDIVSKAREERQQRRGGW